MRRRALAIAAALGLAACGKPKAAQTPGDTLTTRQPASETAESAAAIAASPAAASSAVVAAASSAAGAPVAQNGDTTVEGTVRRVGSVPLVRTVISGAGGPVAVTGTLARELAALDGALVRVVGHPQPASPPPPARAVNVTRYTLVSVHGQTPEVGVLIGRNGALWLAGKDTVALTGVPSDFAAHEGDKVYIVGARNNGKLNVQSYGVIKQGGESPDG